MCECMYTYVGTHYGEKRVPRSPGATILVLRGLLPWMLITNWTWVFWKSALTHWAISLASPCILRYGVSLDLEKQTQGWLVSRTRASDLGSLYGFWVWVQVFILTRQALYWLRISLAQVVHCEDGYSHSTSLYWLHTACQALHCVKRQYVPNSSEVDGVIVETRCPNYCSIAMKRDCDQGNLQKKAFNWRLVYSFRGLAHNHHSRECGSKQKSLVPEQ